MKTLVWFALSIVLLSCGRRETRTLAPNELPGFTVSLPRGDTIDKELSTYPEGNLARGTKGVWAVMVEWRPGPMSAADRDSYAEAWKLDYAKPLTLVPANLEAQTYAGTNHGPARVSFVTCGVRYIVIASLDHQDVEKLHRDVLATFVCKPDPAKERAIGARIALAQPAGWSRVGSGRTVLTLVRDGGAKVVLGLFYATKPDDKTLANLVKNYQGTVGPGDPHPVSAPGNRGWLRVLTCGPETYVAAMYIEQGDGAADRTTIDGVRCLSAGEPDVAWPSAGAELQGAGGT